MAFLLEKLPGFSGLANMMPPKKSKAARKAINDDEPTQDDSKTSSQEAAAGQANEDEENINIFKVEVLYGKRARNAPASETHLQDWLGENFEEKEDHKVNTVDGYENYVSGCVSGGSVAVNQNEFIKAFKQKFPKGSSVKESSAMLSLIRVKKTKKQDGEKPKREKSALAQIKMREVLHTMFTEAGNPSKGVGFRVITTKINAKYPEVNIDKRPKFLLAALERGVSYGHIELIKGIGKLGFYRLPGPAENEEEEKEKKKTAKKEKTADGEEKDKDGDKEADSNEDSEDDNKENDKGDEEGDEEDAKADKDSGKRKTRKKGSSKDKDKKDIKKKKKKAAAVKKYRPFVMHSDPQRIEDTFSLAMTFMVEPKEAGVRRIAKYLEDYYGEDISSDRLRNCLEKGCEKGYWEQVTGSGMSGRFRLLMDSFDPTADDDLIGQITNALVACTEPKQCSATLLKGYLLEYHPEFQMAQRPHLFKKALERGINKKIILRLSGLGASGSFQLYDPFTPTPLILKGEDHEGDYESEGDIKSSKTNWSSREADDGQGYGQFHMSTFQDAYQPRPSKRRGHGRTASTGIKDEALAKKAKSSSRFRAAAVQSKQKKKIRSKPKQPTYHESDSSEDEAPRKSRGKKRSSGRASPRKQKRKSYTAESSNDEKSSEESQSESEDEAPEPPPAKKSRETPAKNKAKTPSKKSTPAKQTKGKSTKKTPEKVRKAAKLESESEQESEQEQKEVTPKKGGRTPRQRSSQGSSSASSRTPQKRGMYAEGSSGEDNRSEDEQPAKKSAKKSKGRRK